MCRETVVNQHLTPSRFIQDSDFRTIPESRLSFHQKNIYVRNKGTFPDNVIGNIIFNRLYTTIITYGYIMQRHVRQPRMLRHSAGKKEFVMKNAQTHPPGKTHMPNIIRSEINGYQHVFPTFRPTILVLKLNNFGLRKCTIFSHIPLFFIICLIKEIIIWVFLHMKFPDFFIKHRLHLLKICLTFSRNKDTIIVQLRHPCMHQLL